MSHKSEFESFLKTWEHESQGAIRAMEAIPADRYDYRPDPKGRSLGEMAWHLSEVEGYMTTGVTARRFDVNEAIPELKRPLEASQLAPGYRRVHELALERLRNLKPEVLDEKVTFFDGTPMAVRDVLWYALLHHFIHHRAQLVLLCRQAGGAPPGLYGPNREELEAIRARMEAGKA